MRPIGRAKQPTAIHRIVNEDSVIERHDPVFCSKIVDRLCFGEFIVNSQWLIPPFVVAWLQ